jgi:hypothetical protein
MCPFGAIYHHILGTEQRIFFIYKLIVQACPERLHKVNFLELENKNLYFIKG